METQTLLRAPGTAQQTAAIVLFTQLHVEPSHMYCHPLTAITLARMFCQTDAFVLSALILVGQGQRKMRTQSNGANEDTDLGPSIGFNGQVHERPGWQVLGSYRAYDPLLMRFHCPDSWSPFGKGGLNAYAYCQNDPVNSVDPTGHAWTRLLGLGLFRSTHMLRRSSLDSITGPLTSAKQLANDTARVTKQALIHNPHIVAPQAPSRRHLQGLASIHADPALYSRLVRGVNRNLASHGNTALSMKQASAMGNIMQEVNAGRISNTTALAREAASWGREMKRGPSGDNLAGLMMNSLGTLISGANDATLQKTGASIRRGSGLMEGGITMVRHGPAIASTIRKG